MTDFKIGQHVYEIFDPNNNGLVTQIDGDDIIVDTPKGKKKYNKSRITRDYHVVIKDFWEEMVGKNCGSRKRRNVSHLGKTKNICTACGI